MTLLGNKILGSTLTPHPCSEDMTNGSLRIKLRYVEASILPSEVYQPLVNLLINEVDNYNIGTAPVSRTTTTLVLHL